MFAQNERPDGVAVDGRGTSTSPTTTTRGSKVSPNGIITTFAGAGVRGFSGDGGPATCGAVVCPKGLAADGQGNIYIVDQYNHRVRKVTPAGRSPRSPARAPRASPETAALPRRRSCTTLTWVAADANGGVYIADPTNQRVRKVSQAERSRRAGGRAGKRGGRRPGEGRRIWPVPQGLAVDGPGNLYIADSADYLVRKVDIGGIITTVAGKFRAGGFHGDGGPAASATVFAPTGLALDGEGNLYIADRANYRVRKVLNTVVAAQSIAFAALANKTYGDPDFAVSASASSGLAVSFAASGSCTAATVRITGAGSCTITASQQDFELERSAGCEPDFLDRKSEPDDHGEHPRADECCRQRRASRSRRPRPAVP